MALIARNVDTGTVIADRVGVAATRATRAVGLLARDGLDPGEALWIVPSRGVHTCWMRFTIDVIALDDRGVVIDRVAHLRPWRVRLPRRGTAGVLELPAGTVDRTGTVVGHRVEFESVAAGDDLRDARQGAARRGPDTEAASLRDREEYRS